MEEKKGRDLDGYGAGTVACGAVQCIASSSGTVGHGHRLGVPFGGFSVGCVRCVRIGNFHLQRLQLVSCVAVVTGRGQRAASAV